MKKHKTISILLTLIMMIGLLTACNSGGETPTESNSTPGGTQTPDSPPDTVASDFEYHNDVALGGAVITKYIGKSDTIKVPETIGGKPVVKVDDSTFQDCGSLVNITTLYFGGHFASDVTITKDGDNTNISSNEKGLFNGCDSLENLTVIVPSGVTKIDDFAFMDCKQLTDVVMSDSVTEIGENIFWFCDSLKTVTMPYSGGSFYWVQTEDGALYSKDFFNGCDSLERVTVFVPDSIAKIDDYAFEDFQELTDVIISDSVTTIGENVFVNSTSLKNVTMYHHGGIFFDSHVSGNNTGSGMQFQGCDSLERVTVTILDGVTEIEKYAFVHSQITDIIIAESVVSIGDSAFADCESLKNITIPNSVTKIGSYVFSECYSLESVIIGNGVTAIDNQMFQNCDSLESVTIGSGIMVINDSMFQNFTSLKTVTIGNNVTSIGSMAFAGCESLTSMEIPDSVTSIGIGAFSGCESLTSVEIPDSVTSIGTGAFSGIPDLTATYKGITYKSDEKTIGEKTTYFMPDEFYDAINNR